MPMRKIIVTDLTRFPEGKVCIAGSDIRNGECIRPMPYLTESICQQLQILPGAILSGIFTAMPNIIGPHQEDTKHDQLQFIGACKSDQFKEALEFGLFNSVAEGFEIKLASDQKCVPLDHVLSRSIITIRVNPTTINIVEDDYNPGRIKMNFVDGSDQLFRYLPITDLGFYTHAMAHHKADDLESLNKFIHKQEHTYIRIGLSRNWIKRPGYWMQVNGIYTFPGFHKEIRSYS
jgi:hypothetical protein